MHLLIDAFGAFICGVVFYGLNAVFHFSVTGLSLTAVSVALINTLFRSVMVMSLLPMVGLLEKTACRIVSGTSEQ